MVKRERDWGFDTLKGFLIFLVVLAHFLQMPGREQTPEEYVLLSVIYSFHMPAFIFISGYFSRPRRQEAGQVTGGRTEEKLLQSLLLPFIIFHLLMWALRSHSLKTILTPAWTMWYLLSLFFWKISVPSLSRIRSALLLAVVLSLLTGFTNAGTLMSVSRTAAMLPFFLAGYQMREETLERLRKGPRFIPVIGIALFLAAAGILAFKGIPLLEVFYMDRSYAGAKLSCREGAALRAFALLAGLSLTVCLILIVPRRRTLLSGMGRNTMTIYLSHSFILVLFSKVLSASGMGLPAGGLPGLLSAAVFAAVVCAVFGNARIRSIYDRMMGRISEALIMPGR